MANPGEQTAKGTKSVLRSTVTGKRLEGYKGKFKVAGIHEAIQSKRRAKIAAGKKKMEGYETPKSVGTGRFPKANKVSVKSGAGARRGIAAVKKKA
jgi:hypothetical protein